MPGIAQNINAIDDSNETDSSDFRNTLVGNGTLPYQSFNGSSVSSNGFWSKHRDDMSYNQLQKFWCELTPQAQHKLMRIDKHTLFEHARKNMYCSRCNGLLLEGYLQIVMYGKSLQQDATSGHYNGRATNFGDLCMDNGCQDDVVDPSIHPWGGITTARDGTLTLLDCYLCSKSLKGLQNVFDSARARERERKLLYPDACGGGGRGWISQGIAGYGRGHGTRESCALHTARLSVETLVDFWSALGDETRQSLLRMKEEDFIERLMYRFDSKRFCRDCRRNVIREFKELKELKRVRKEPRCTSWFCVADTAFQYEVSHDTVQADWHQTFVDACGTYHHFEWAIGTGEGKSDILEFENVGLSVRVQVNGLDLSGLNACYITLRAWKMDGRCNELCVKAHALRGQQCVHCRLVVGDGHVTITVGENIRRFFEHAEEAEEEEDDDSVDKDGNELDGECSRPQKHAKSPELAREFLLDAAAVIFKEQVEKAFREGTARQNAHSIFVCLALKLLEERVHVACREIITLEKQMKLLEEEEKEKREEEERKERRRIKEREKKLRRKERLREKESKEKKCDELNIDPVAIDTSKEATPCVDEDANVERRRDYATAISEATPPSLSSPDVQDDQILMGCSYTNMENHPEDTLDGEFGNIRVLNTSHPYNQIKYSRRKVKFHKDTQQDVMSKWRRSAALSENDPIASKYDSRYHADGLESIRSINCFNRQLRPDAAKSNSRNGLKLSEILQCTSNRTGDRCDSHVCSGNHHNEYRSKPDSHIMRSTRESKYVNKLESSSDVSKSYYRGKCTQVECAREVNGRAKCNTNACNSPITKRVWEPLDSQKKYAQSNSVSVVASRLTLKVEDSLSDQAPESSVAVSSNELSEISLEAINEDNDTRDLTRSSGENCRDRENGFHSTEKSQHTTVDSSLSSSSNSDNCSSCLSEGDSNTSSSNTQNLESTSTSDSEESGQTFDGRGTLHYLESRLTECRKVVKDQDTMRGQDAKIQGPVSRVTNSSNSLPTEAATYCESVISNASVNAQPQSVLPHIHNQTIQYPIFQAPTMGYYHQSPVSWPPAPTNGLMSYPYSNHYLYANGFGYDLNNNAQFMQYGTLQHLPPPLINPVHVPVFPPANGVSTKDHANAANPNVIKEARNTTQKMASTEQHSAETLTTVDAGQNGKSSKIDKGNSDFSLFHFGGPVAFSTGFKAEPVLPSVGLSENHSPDGNGPCNRKDSIEEYNLFAASNGIQFSIF